MPGGFTIILLLPLVGFLLSRYTPRWLLLFGLLMLSFSLFHMTGFDLQIDFRTRGHGARDSGRRNGIPVCSHQHGRVRFSSARQEQCRFRLDEPGAQHRRQRRNFRRHHHAGPPDADASERFCQSSERGQRRAASHDSGSLARHDGAWRERRRCHSAGLRAGPGHRRSGRPPCWPISTVSGFSGWRSWPWFPMVFLMKKSKPGGGIAVH